MKKRLALVAVWLVVVTAFVTFAVDQGPNNIANLMGRTDNAFSLKVVSRTLAGGAAQGPRAIGSLMGKTDSNGNLYVTLASGSVLPSPTFTGQGLFADGTAPLPSIAWASQPNTGLYKAGANDVSISSNGARQFAFIGPDMYFGLGSNNATMRWGASSDVVLRQAAAGQLSFNNAGLTVGSLLKFDALPTIGSGFGTSPSVVAGGTPLNFTVNVGTGGTATTGVANFNGTAFPVAPGCTLGQSAGTFTTYTATTTAITLTAAVAWPASTLVTVHCISSK